MKDALHLEQKAQREKGDIGIEEYSLMLSTFGNMYHCTIESITLLDWEWISTDSLLGNIPTSLASKDCIHHPEEIH